MCNKDTGCNSLINHNFSLEILEKSFLMEFAPFPVISSLLMRICSILCCILYTSFDYVESFKIRNLKQ